MKDYYPEFRAPAFMTPRVCTLLLFAFYLFIALVDARAFDVSISNNSATHDLRVVTYIYDPAISNVANAVVEHFAGPHQRVYVKGVLGKKIYALFYYGVAGSETWVLNGTIGADPLRDVNPLTIVQFSWNSGSPSQRIWDTDVVASASFSPSVDQLDTFKAGFYFIIAGGLFALMFALVRRLGSQDHRP